MPTASAQRSENIKRLKLEKQRKTEAFKNTPWNEMFRFSFEEFIDEYLKDRDPVLALIRLGITEKAALGPIGESVMLRPEVQQAIMQHDSDLIQEGYTPMAQRAILGIYRIAHDSQSPPNVRLAAFSKLVDLFAATDEGKAVVEDTSGLSDEELEKMARKLGMAGPAPR